MILQSSSLGNQAEDLRECYEESYTNFGIVGPIRACIWAWQILGQVECQYRNDVM